MHSAVESALHYHLKPSSARMNHQKSAAVQCTVESENYTIDQLEKILRVKRRQVFNYAKTICEIWHWEPEATFKPDNGKFSARMLEEMRKLQEKGVSEYQRVVGRENHQPTFATAAIVTVLPEETHSKLNQQLATFQQSAIAQSQTLAELLVSKLQEIQRQNLAASQQTQILDSSELLAAQNRGYARAIQVHQTEEAAMQSALNQLRTMKLNGMVADG